jgi:hypothetical protein
VVRPPLRAISKEQYINIYIILKILNNILLFLKGWDTWRFYGPTISLRSILTINWKPLQSTRTGEDLDPLAWLLG